MTVALVTGASRGIGRATALRLARDGNDISIGFFRDREGAEKVRAEIEELGRRAIIVKGHVGDEGKCRAIVEQTATELDPPTIVISNAASGVLKPLDQIDARGWNWTMDVNARALLVLAQASREGMLTAGGGCIVALSSLGSERVLPGYGIVGTSKAAIEALGRYLAVEGAPDNIRVNVVSAGVVDTDALKHFPNREAMLAEASLRTPAGRMVTPDDVASAVSFLCSDDAWMIRGQTVRVDGGYSLIA